MNLLFSDDVPVTNPPQTEVQDGSGPVQTTVNAHSGHYGMKPL